LKKNKIGCSEMQENVKGPVSLERMETSFVVMPKDANHYGNVHGGVIMLYADNLAYAIGSKFSKMNVVTARISEMNFLKPVKTGDMVILTADIIRLGKTSMDVKVKISGDKLKTGEVFEVADALFTMVAVDGSGKPKQIKR
jgi:uncharacterized protein (TIGR00369 family)